MTDVTVHTDGVELPGYLDGPDGVTGLVVFAQQPDRVAAVVSRGGRPDLTAADLGALKCPVPFVVGGDDTQVIEMNRTAAGRLTVEHEIHLVEGAGHLFEGPGELDEVADRAASWFRQHLA